MMGVKDLAVCGELSRFLIKEQQEREEKIYWKEQKALQKSQALEKNKMKINRNHAVVKGKGKVKKPTRG